MGLRGTSTKSGLRSDRERPAFRRGRPLFAGTGMLWLAAAAAVAAVAAAVDVAADAVAVAAADGAFLRASCLQPE